MDPLPDSPAAILAQADLLRDRRHWAEAETLYRAYLAERPHHWQIHVQLGHCVKEQGDPESALPHYQRARGLAPEDFDPPLQISHALRLLGRGGEAAEAVAEALARAPDDLRLRRADALLRHRRLVPEDAPCPPPAPRPDGPPTQFAFDVTDLLDYLRDARTPTGIQRVQMGTLGAMLGSGAAILLVAYDPSAWRWWHVEEAAFRRVLALARIGALADDPAWRQATAVLCHADARPEAPIRAGATLTSLGNAWGVEDYFRGLRMLRERLPIRYVAFVHDCVPLVMPEHCLGLTVRLYARWFAALSLHADAVLANSEATAADFRRFAAPLGAVPPVTVVKLAAEGLGPPAAAGAARAAAEQLPAPLPGEAYVLFVATLESRKNHLMAFEAWLSLLRRLGPAAVPRLVCVGKPGWRADAALALLERSPALRRKVSVLNDVSDLALTGLYAGCVFTLYNSFHEGWGLPVSESLAAGKLAVVPAQSGLLESGAPGAVFFAPQDEPDLVETLARLITDSGHRRALEAKIDRAAAGRGWVQAASEVQASLAAPPLPVAERHMPAGQRLALGLVQAGDPSVGMAWAEHCRQGLGWWWQEGWGCWTRDGIATLALPLPVPPGTLLRVMLDLRGPPTGLGIRLRLRGMRAEAWRRLDLGADERVTCVLQAEAGPGGLLVEIDSRDGVRLGDRANRMVGVGIEGVMACREDDLAARLAALESAAS